ncbi:MAG: lysophospholipid acyltransferase family protein [Candidatus Aminicenantes bacterium]|jgi:KDO2-lipid IV(A) lauroyltransferase|nr:lysophospholipid acyltransferase family protein [Candidatus Aminicenantes bacterium]
MPQKKVSFKSHLEYALFAGLISLIKYSPLRFLHLGKKAMVFFLKKGSRRHSRLISHNLAMAFPSASPAFLAGLKKNIYNHFGSIFIEIARTFARRDSQAILSRSRVNNLQIIVRALQKNRGLIIFSAHFGNWEWIPLILNASLGKDIHSIARPMDNVLIEKKVKEFREAMGSRIIYKQGSLRTILKRLSSNEIVYLLIDQNTVPREGVFVDFFAKKATAITTVSQLYLKKNIPVVPVFLHYQGQDIILDILPEIDYPVSGQNPAALTELTQQLTWLIEAQIRKFPEQWFWFHNRWKTKPQGEASERK